MNVIDVQGVTKRFHADRDGAEGRGRSILPALLQRGRSREFSAVDGVSFSVEQGETVAIVGPNGSGKSTLLTIVTGVIYPTRGRVRVEGRVCPLIRLGAGFHHDLSGRDNVYLNGSVLGMTRRQIDDSYRSIVEFAELQDFMGMPLKRLSQGMQIRLGFSVAVHAQPDILVVDEVLAVGDASFQRKCFDWLRSFQGQGGSILFVSHDTRLVYALSDRILHLRNGAVEREERVTEQDRVPFAPELTGSGARTWAGALSGASTHD